MKIRKVWFGLIVLLIVFTCLVLGYGVYESILKADEYVRIYVKNAKVEDDETSYYLTEKGRKLQNIIYELAIFNIEEEYSGEELEDIKKELEKLKYK